MQLRKFINGRMSALVSERSSWDSQYRDLSDFILPNKGRFALRDRNDGKRKGNDILNNRATLDARTLQSGMMSGMTNPARPWFKLTTQDPDMREVGAVKRWLDDVERILREIFAKSNLYNALHGGYGELGVFGTHAMLLEEDFNDVVRAYPMTCGSYYLATGSRRTVDTMYRKTMLSVGQLVQRFGEDKVGDTVLSLYNDGHYETAIEVHHAIEPNTDRDATRKDSKNMPWRSIWWLPDSPDEQYLRISGYKSFPVLAPRWDVTGNDTYGRSPGMDTIGDVKQLQQMELDSMKASQKMIDPPMMGPESLRQRAKNTLPGGVTYLDTAQGMQGFAPLYQIDYRLDFAESKINQVEDRISRAFYADLFMMLSQSDRRQITAREVEEKHEEKLLMIGPVLQRLEDEELSPMIDKAFDYASEAGILPPAPDEIAGQELGVEYISILAQAQKLVGTAGIERFTGYIGNLAAVKPDVMDKFDTDQAIDEYGEMTGVPSRIIRTEEETAEIRARRAEEQRQMQQAEMAAQAAQGAKTLSEADTQTDNALTRMIGIE